MGLLDPLTAFLKIGRFLEALNRRILRQYAAIMAVLSCRNAQKS